MKKILFLIPLLGICSSLLAQAPTVTNVQAEQVQGTKDVAISFELTGKGESVHGEVWFKENDSMTIWTKVSSIFSEISPGDLQPANLIDFDPASGTTTTHASIHIGLAEVSPTTKNFIWKAGDDVPNINTADAKIRIIAFYPKMNEDGVTEKPGADQVSGWNGEGDFGGSGTSPDSNGTSDELDVYYLDSTMVGEATSYAKEDPGYYAFEAFYDEPAEHNGFVGTEVKQLIAVYDDAGIWRLDESIGPWQLNPSLFPTLNSVGVYIESNGLVSQGKLTYSDPGAGDGI